MEYLSPLAKLYFFISYTLVLMVLATLIYDLILSGSWAPFCFRYGIPIYRRSFDVQHLDDFNLLQTYLANNQSSLIAQWQPESKLEALLVNKAKRVHRRYYIQYKHLDATTIAYKRMKGEQDSRLHGRISLHKKTRQIEVVGYFNWISPIMPFLFIIFLMVFPFPLIIIAPIFIYATVAGQKSRHKSLTKRCYDFFRETKEETPKQNRSTTGNKSTVTTFEDIDLILEENPKSTKKGKYVQAPSDLL